MVARVTGIQIGGGVIVHSLEEACKEYLMMLEDPQEPVRTKINFAIELPDGSYKSITIREEDGGVVAYGNFEGLPTFLDYAQELKSETESYKW